MGPHYWMLAGRALRAAKAVLRRKGYEEASAVLTKWHTWVGNTELVLTTELKRTPGSMTSTEFERLGESLSGW